MSKMSEMSLNPAEHGMAICTHCNGYGSSLKDPEGVDRCTVCEGTGLVPLVDPTV